MADKIEKGGLFEKFFAATTEVIKLAKKPLFKQQLVRKFSSAIDDCTSKLIDGELLLQQQMEKIEDIKINDLLKIKQDINNALETKKELISLYSDIFGEDYKEAA